MGRMTRFAASLSAALMLAGCEVVPMIAAIPSAIVEPIFGEFGSEERSIPATMRASLVGAKKALNTMALAIDLVEYRDDGYDLGFGNERMDGRITLIRQTERLTTVRVKVKTRIRQESVEEAVLDQIELYATKARPNERARFRGYPPVHRAPKHDSPVIGLYRPKANLAASRAYKPGWLAVKLPSGKRGYIEGRLQDHVAKEERR